MTFDERERQFNAALDEDMRQHRDYIASKIQHALENSRRDETRILAVVTVAIAAFGMVLLVAMTFG